MDKILDEKVLAGTKANQYANAILHVIGYVSASIENGDADWMGEERLHVLEAHVNECHLLMIDLYRSVLSKEANDTEP